MKIGRSSSRAPNKASLRRLPRERSIVEKCPPRDRDPVCQTQPLEPVEAFDSTSTPWSPSKFGKRWPSVKTTEKS